MADAVTSTTLYDGPGEVIMLFTNTSDGTGESAVLKVDVSALSGFVTGDLVAIEKIVYATYGMAVKLLWDADTDAIAFTCPADETAEVCWERRAPLKNTAGTGVTGDIRLTTIGHTAGDTYSITLYMRKYAA